MSKRTMIIAVFALLAAIAAYLSFKADRRAEYDQEPEPEPEPTPRKKKSKDKEPEPAPEPAPEPQAGENE